MAFGTCFIKGNISDGITQRKLENPSDENRDNDRFLDYKRNIRFAIWSGVYCGSIQHWIYNVLYAKIFPGTSIMSRLICTTFDCTIHGPCVYMPSYYVSKSLMTGGNAKVGLNEYRDNAWEILMTYWKVWVPTVFGVMFFVPPEFRVLAIGGVSLFWLILLSYVAPMVDINNDPDVSNQYSA